MHLDLFKSILGSPLQDLSVFLHLSSLAFSSNNSYFSVSPHTQSPWNISGNKTVVSFVSCATILAYISHLPVHPCHWKIILKQACPTGWHGQHCSLGASPILPINTIYVDPTLEWVHRGKLSPRWTRWILQAVPHTISFWRHDEGQVGNPVWLYFSWWTWCSGHMGEVQRCNLNKRVWVVRETWAAADRFGSILLCWQSECHGCTKVVCQILMAKHH